MTVNVKFISETTVKEGKTLLKASKDTRVKLKDSCGGDGKCGKCEVRVISGKLSEPSKEEMKILGLKKIEKGYRLACQAEVIEGEVLVEVIED
jgi:ferredoxin